MILCELFFQDTEGIFDDLIKIIRLRKTKNIAFIKNIWGESVSH